VEYLQASGLRVALRRRGVGPPVLLLHGGLCDSRVWRVEIESFGEDFSVVAWDAPGCGGSDDPPEHFGLGDYADCLAACLAQLGLGPWHVVGHSWGSSLALELCRRRPDVVATLVLVSAYAGWAGSLAPEEVQRRLEFALDVADDASNRRWHPASMPGLFSDVMPHDRAAELAEIMADIRPVGTRAMARALAEADLRDALASIDVPTLIVHGDADERSSLDVARSLHGGLSNAALTILSGLGHECFLENATAFDTAVRTFLTAQA
jgi:pimeloyl-ACP methyl ester carboxylesterase